MYHALIDADICVYRVGWTTEEEDEGIARWRLDEMIKLMLDALECETYTCYLTSTDHSNFRYELFPEYKANRKDKPKPRHYELLRDHLKTNHKTIEIFGQEADDALGIALMTDPNHIICSIDKDLDQIPGWHYNFVQDRKYKVSEIEAARSFYEQVLVGDKATDNIEGCPKIGKVKANRMLEGCQTELEMMEQVVKAYQKAYPENEWAERLLLAGRLLWIRKEENQEWNLSGALVSKMLLEHFFELKESLLNTKMLESNTSFQKADILTPPTSKFTVVS